MQPPIIHRCVPDFRRLKPGQEIPDRAMAERRAAAMETVRAEIYSYLDLIAKNTMKLKPGSKPRIGRYSSSEVQIHLDDMRSEATNLLRTMDTMEKMGIKIRAEDRHDKSILKTLERIHASLVSEMEAQGVVVEEEPGPAAASDDKLLELEEARMHIVLADEVMTEEECFDQYRRSWVSNWSGLYGSSFTETTTVSPMHFAHATPGHGPHASFCPRTLQMYSIKVTDIKDALELKWPLQVYGVVAARDTVDRNRNIIFSRQRDDCQQLSQKDPFLRLTGPSRAIVTEDPINVEIELRVKGRTESEDRVLMSQVWYYSSRACPLYTPLHGQFCTLVLSSEELKRSVQATVVGVCVTEGTPWPFEYGGRVVCFSRPRKARLPDSKHIAGPLFRQIVLEDGAMAMDSDGYLGLSRQVVSVELFGSLEVGIYAYSQSRGIAAQIRVYIEAQKCNVTRHKCCLGNSKMEITVAWSRLVQDKRCLAPSC